MNAQTFKKNPRMQKNDILNQILDVRDLLRFMFIHYYSLIFTEKVIYFLPLVPVKFFPSFKCQVFLEIREKQYNNINKIPNNTH